ncbi:MAG TPA: hypothetical protein DCE56_37355 [Cyanobacteria bacterium UBA8553]|nr:hypothetical protein [Cyanobacteria bacterium UBA8553]
MKRDLQDFINERAKHLAVVYLTRRQDLVTERMTADYGFDILVTILRDKLPTGRVFGVQVKGQDKAFKDIQELSLSFTGKETNYFLDLPFPVCVFLFTMEDDRGYYRWIRYTVSESNQVLHSIEPDRWYPLDEHEIGQIVDDVNAWYDAKSHSAA